MTRTTRQPFPYLDVVKQALEGKKLTLEFTKHLSTLTTGLLAVSIAFVDKLESQEYWRPLLPTGVGLLLVPLVALTFCTLFVLSTGRTYEGSTTWLLRLVQALASIGLGAFLLAVAAISLFVVRDLI